MTWQPCLPAITWPRHHDDRDGQQDRTTDEGDGGGGRLVVCADDSFDAAWPRSAAWAAPEVTGFANTSGQA
jgi:hypothetical protein